MEQIDKPKAILSHEEIDNQDIQKKVDRLFDLVKKDSQDSRFDQFEQYIKENEIPENVLMALSKKIDEESLSTDGRIKNSQEVKRLIEQEWGDEDHYSIDKKTESALASLEMEGHPIQYKEGLHRGSFDYWVDGNHFTMQLPANRFILALREPGNKPRIRFGKMVMLNGKIEVEPGFSSSSYTGVKKLPNGQFDLAEGSTHQGSGQDALSSIDFEDAYSQDPDTNDLAKTSVSPKSFFEEVSSAFGTSRTPEESVAKSDLVLSEFPNEPQALNLKAWSLYERALSMEDPALVLEAKKIANQLERVRDNKIKIDEMDTIVRIEHKINPGNARKKFKELANKVFENYAKKDGNIKVTRREADVLQGLMDLFKINDVNEI